MCSPIQHVGPRDIFIHDTTGHNPPALVYRPTLGLCSVTTSASSSPDPADLKAGQPPPYDARHRHLREMMAHFGIPALLIVDPINIFYATGAHKSRQPASPVRVLDSLRATSQ